MALLTVVVPIYNKERYLVKCIQSIRNQTLKDIRIVLVDDGSTDGSGALCDKLAIGDERICVCHLEHQGPIGARYTGMRQTETEYVTFVDADDWIEPQTYEILEKYMKIGYDVIKYLMVLDYNNGMLENYKNKHIIGTYDRNKLEREIFPTLVWDIPNDCSGVSSSLCDKIVKRSILEKSFLLAQNLHYHFCEDSTIAFPMYKWVNSLAITDHVLYHHCKYGNEESSYLNNEYFFDYLYLWYQHLRQYVDFIPNAIEQIEKIYMDAMQPRKLIYGDRPDHIRHLFPFKSVKGGSDIVIWGYGVVGQSYMEQIQRSGYCNVVAIVDQNYKNNFEKNVDNPEIIKNIKLDYVVVAIWNDEIIKEIRQTLLGWGIPENQIITRGQ